MGVSSNGGFPQQLLVFLMKMTILGCEMGCFHHFRKHPCGRLGGSFNYICFICKPNLGKMIHFDVLIFFQPGWFNHQLVDVVFPQKKIQMKSDEQVGISGLIFLVF